MIFYCPDLTQGQHEFSLSSVESKHCIKVLRVKEGQSIELVNGKGLKAQAIITKAHMSACQVSIQKVTEKKNERNIHIAIAPTKQMERMEWLVEKAVELGVTELSFLQCQNNERRSMRMDRLEKIAVSALKQSQRFHLPQIHEMIAFEKFILTHQNGYIAHCLGENKIGIHSISKPGPILIGPEGDFTEKEVHFAVQHGYQALTLGEYRLRTETAALFCVAMLSK